MNFIQELYDAKENGYNWVAICKDGEYVEVYDDEPYICGGNWGTYAESHSYYINIGYDELLSLLKNFDPDVPIEIDDAIYHCNLMYNKRQDLHCAEKFNYKSLECTKVQDVMAEGLHGIAASLMKDVIACLYEMGHEEESHDNYNNLVQLINKIKSELDVQTYEDLKDKYGTLGRRPADGRGWLCDGAFL